MKNLKNCMKSLRKRYEKSTTYLRSKVTTVVPPKLKRQDLKELRNTHKMNLTIFMNITVKGNLDRKNVFHQLYNLLGNVKS